MDAAEELMRKIVIKRVFFLASGVRKKGIDLGIMGSTDDLEAIELERNIGRLTRRNEPPGPISHREAAGPYHQILGIRGTRVVGPKVKKCLLQSGGVLIHLRGRRGAVPLVSRNDLNE